MPELASSIEGTLENVWAKEVIDTELPFDVRRRALLAYMHVSAVWLWSGELTCRLLKAWPSSGIRLRTPRSTAPFRS